MRSSGFDLGLRVHEFQRESPRLRVEGRISAPQLRVDLVLHVVLTNVGHVRSLHGHVSTPRPSGLQRLIALIHVLRDVSSHIHGESRGLAVARHSHGRPFLGGSLPLEGSPLPQGHLLALKAQLLTLQIQRPHLGLQLLARLGLNLQSIPHGPVANHGLQAERRANWIITEPKERGEDRENTQNRDIPPLTSETEGGMDTGQLGGAEGMANVEPIGVANPGAEVAKPGVGLSAVVDAELWRLRGTGAWPRGEDRGATRESPRAISPTENLALFSPILLGRCPDSSCLRSFDRFG
nr:hypothetical protein Iba_chr06dCG9820 [Ipomoea batatas]